MDELIKRCWKCGNPFALEYVHKETGHVILTCANCYAPFNLQDDEGLRIMESMDAPESQIYAKEWRELLAGE